MSNILYTGIYHVEGKYYFIHRKENKENDVYLLNDDIIRIKDGIEIINKIDTKARKDISYDIDKKDELSNKCRNRIECQWVETKYSKEYKGVLILISNTHCEVRDDLEGNREDSSYVISEIIR